MDNRIVLITGGSSDIAKPLIFKILNKTNFKIIAVKYSSKESYSDNRIIEINADFSTENGIKDFLKTIESYNIYYYIQLHGNALLDDTIEAQTYAEISYLLNINILSTNMILAKLLPKMKTFRYGRITLTGTASANYGGGKNSFSYGLSKHSVNYLVKHLAKYYSEFGILTNAIFPGFIKTKFHTDILKRDKNFLEERGKTVRVGYSGLAKDVSDIIFNITFKNNFICGEIIKIDGADFI